MRPVAAREAETTSLKEWAKHIAAEAPPLSDDQFHQLHALFVGSARLHERNELKTAA
jgi:hypothetical protein